MAIVAIHQHKDNWLGKVCENNSQIVSFMSSFIDEETPVLILPEDEEELAEFTYTWNINIEMVD